MSFLSVRKYGIMKKKVIKMNSIIEKINFFSKNAIFESINDSNSGAILKKVTDHQKTYFLKIVPKNSIDIDKILKIIEIYENHHINTVKLLSYGTIEDKIYLVYDFIDGNALNTVYDKYDIDSYYNMGLEIGKSYQKINFNCKQDNIFKQEYDIDDFINSIISEFLNLYNGKLMYLKDIMIEDKINMLTKKIKKLLPCFYNENKVYIHADIHPKNIMIDKNNQLYIIDIESFHIDYFVMNLRWSIMAAFKNDKNKSFFKGFIDGYYNHTVDNNFSKQLTIILIINFMEHIINFSKDKSKNYIIEYTTKVNKIFDTINIDSENNIIYN